MAIRLVPKSERNRALIDVRELLPSWKKPPPPPGAPGADPAPASPQDALREPAVSPETPGARGAPEQSPSSPLCTLLGVSSASPDRDAEMPRVELSKYEVIDEEFIIEVGHCRATYVVP